LDVLNDADRSQVLIDLGLPVAQSEVVPTSKEVTITLPQGIVPTEWVMEQFHLYKGQDGDGRSKEQRKAYNKALYKKLQDMRTHHNAAIRKDMKADKVQVISGEVAKRVREANARAETPVDIPDDLLESASTELAAKLIAALGQS
jgi:hypothetical protein